jgi:SsrA-binding protein
MASETLSKNKKAYADYEILETYEAGIQLSGAEVKSVRAHNANLKGGYIDIDPKDQVWVNEIHISPYKFAHDKNLPPTRKRKLLLHKKEINKIQKQLNEKGITCVPLELYSKGGLIKMKIGLVRGKKKFDKRQDLKNRAQNLEVARALKKHLQ